MVAGLIGPCMENVQQVVVGVSNLEVEPALHQHQHMEVLNVLVLLRKKAMALKPLPPTTQKELGGPQG